MSESIRVYFLLTQSQFSTTTFSLVDAESFHAATLLNFLLFRQICNSCYPNTFVCVKCIFVFAIVDPIWTFNKFRVAYLNIHSQGPIYFWRVSRFSKERKGWNHLMLFKSRIFFQTLQLVETRKKFPSNQFLLISKVFKWTFTNIASCDVLKIICTDQVFFFQGYHMISSYLDFVSYPIQLSI